MIGYEVAGDVESVGDGVESVKPGDRVIAGTRFGGQAELAVTDAGNVFPLPDGWSYEKGAAVPVVYVTAYAGMIRYGNVLEGERVLIHAAAGGVGIAATQIGKHLGAELYGTASASKHDAVRGFGIEHPIDYHSQDFVKEIRRDHEREETARPRDGRGRRQQLPQELVATARRRAPRRLRCVRGGRR